MWGGEEEGEQGWRTKLGKDAAQRGTGFYLVRFIWGVHLRSIPHDGAQSPPSRTWCSFIVCKPVSTVLVSDYHKTEARVIPAG